MTRRPAPTGTPTAAPGETPPRRIPVNGKPIRLRWLQQVIWSFLAANVGTLIIAALYYLFVQLKWQVGDHTILYLKPDWDHLFGFRGWAADRHDVRDVYEALLATLFVKSLLANWRKRDRRAPGWYVLLSPLIIVVVAFPIVAAGIWLINHALPSAWRVLFTHHAVRNPVHLPSQLDWLGTYLAGYPWQPAVIGILAGLVVHRAFLPAGNTVQLYFIGRSVDRTRDGIAASEANPYRHLPRWPWPPVIRERAAWIMLAGLPVPDRTRNIAWTVRVITVVLAALAAYGAYIRYVVAKGH
jgi:hypothetical protein